VIDSATRAAIRAFQATLGAPQTGFLSSEQRLALAITAAELAAERAEQAAYGAQVAAARSRLVAGPDGAIHYDDGAKYYGETDPGRRLRHGSGVLVRPDGQRYEGEWVNDFPSGVGVHHGSDGTRYAGEWNQRLPSGYGVQSAPAAGSRVVGEWNPGPDTAWGHVNGYAIFIPPSEQREQRGIWRNSRLLIPLFQP
jgi:hypothetical protein